jgi:hypothetical protein
MSVARHAGVSHIGSEHDNARDPNEVGEARRENEWDDSLSIHGAAPFSAKMLPTNGPSAIHLRPEEARQNENPDEAVGGAEQ